MSPQLCLLCIHKYSSYILLFRPQTKPNAQYTVIYTAILPKHFTLAISQYFEHASVIGKLSVQSTNFDSVASEVQDG